MFLDANVLFSAAYREGSGLERLGETTLDITLLSSPYAIEEANRNLEERDARARLQTLIAALEIVPDVAGGDVPTGVMLPEKDLPILFAAIAAGATHLLTGDRAHFGPYFGRRMSGVLLQRPGDYPAARGGGVDVPPRTTGRLGLCLNATARRRADVLSPRTGPRPDRRGPLAAQAASSPRSTRRRAAPRLPRA